MLAIIKKEFPHESHPDLFPEKGTIGTVLEDDVYCEFFNLCNIEWHTPSMNGESKRVNKRDVRGVSDFVVVNPNKRKSNKPCDEAYKVDSVDDMTGMRYSYWAVELFEYKDLLEFMEKHNGKYIGLNKHNNPCIVIKW